MKFKRKLTCLQLPVTINWILNSFTLSLMYFGGVTSRFVGNYCETKSIFNLPAVTPMCEENIPVVGCLSKTTNSRGEEVHALHLEEVDGWSTPKVVTVHIGWTDDRSYSEKPFILLLHADFTTLWKLEGARLNNSIYNRIVVTKDSQVIENRDVQVIIQRRISGEIKHLLNWLNKRYKTVTSYAKIGRANNIYLNIGNKNAGSLAKCSFENLKYTHIPHVAAFAQDVIKIEHRQGCVLNKLMDKSNGVVHIIKIRESCHDEVDGTVRKAIIHLSSRSQHYVDNDVALILHSSQPIEWILYNDSLKGRLEVVTEGNVIASRNILASEMIIRTEALPNTTKELMANSIKWFGPSFTYTEVESANSVRILADLSDAEGPPPKQIDFFNPSQDQTGHRPRAIGNKDVIKSRLRHGHTTRVGSETHMLIKSKKPLKGHDIIQMPSVMLIDVMTIECLLHQMTVSFPRITMEQLGLKPDDISLVDPRCSVIVNDTHYVLSSPLQFCGTKREIEDEKIIYKNSVHFHFHVQKIGSLYSSWTKMESSTLPVDDEDGGVDGSGSSALPTFDSNEANSLEFQCEYLHFGSISEIEVKESQSETKDAVTRGIFSMELSRDSSFISPIAQNEYPFVLLEYERLYVEIRLKTGLELQVVTEECWLSDYIDPKSAPVVQLINNKCPTEATVRFELSSDVVSNRFSFQLGNKYFSHLGLFLHCKLGVCSADKTGAKLEIKTCNDQKDICPPDGLQTHLESQHETYTIFTRGPFQVKQALPNTKNMLSNIPFKQLGKLDLDGVFDGETLDVKCTTVSEQPLIVLGVSTESVIAIAFASFVIGVGLSAVLWCIYLKTDPRRIIHRQPTHHHSSCDLSGHSGSLTPSSQSPMTA